MSQTNYPNHSSSKESGYSSSNGFPICGSVPQPALYRYDMADNEIDPRHLFNPGTQDVSRFQDYSRICDRGGDIRAISNPGICKPGITVDCRYTSKLMAGRRVRTLRLPEYCPVSILTQQYCDDYELNYSR